MFQSKIDMAGSTRSSEFSSAAACRVPVNMEDSLKLDERTFRAGADLTIEEYAYLLDLMSYYSTQYSIANRYPNVQKAVQTDLDTSSLNYSVILEGERIVDNLYIGIGNAINELHYPLVDVSSATRYTANGNEFSGKFLTNMKHPSFYDTERGRQMAYTQEFKDRLGNLMQLARKLKNIYPLIEQKCRDVADNPVLKQNLEKNNIFHGDQIDECIQNSSLCCAALTSEKLDTNYDDIIKRFDRIVDIADKFVPVKRYKSDSTNGYLDIEGSKVSKSLICENAVPDKCKRKNKNKITERLNLSTRSNVNYIKSDCKDRTSTSLSKQGTSFDKDNRKNFVTKDLLYEQQPKNNDGKNINEPIKALISLLEQDSLRFDVCNNEKLVTESLIFEEPKNICSKSSINELIKTQTSLVSVDTFSLKYFDQNFGDKIKNEVGLQEKVEFYKDNDIIENKDVTIKNKMEVPLKELIQNISNSRRKVIVKLENTKLNLEDCYYTDKNIALISQTVQNVALNKKEIPAFKMNRSAITGSKSKIVKPFKSSKAESMINIESNTPNSSVLKIKILDANIAGPSNGAALNNSKSIAKQYAQSKNFIKLNIMSVKQSKNLVSTSKTGNTASKRMLRQKTGSVTSKSINL